jgi:dihydrofolate synthase/folylpolyglutamate synthase
VATPDTLDGWLDFVERHHPAPIALGLDRVSDVFGRLGVRLSCPVFAVGGTNGKGSTCAMLDSILRAAGYRTGLYTSPHLLRYNERVRLDGQEADDSALCEAFAAVEQAREGVPLTYFEFGTLAAVWLFVRLRPDAVVLEIGLGGRLDAVNIIDSDCAVLTSVGIDHVEYLGGTREDIGKEKAGIFRSGKPAVVVEPDPPQSVLDQGTRIGARLLRFGGDFGYRAERAQWEYWGPGGRRSGLAHPALHGAVQLRNAAGALCALDSLCDRLPLAVQDVRRGLAEVSLAGRFEALPGRPEVVLDVAHNPQAARTLAENVAAWGFTPRTIAVVGMLRDKDISGVARELAATFARWHVATLDGPRGATAEELARALEACGIRVPIVRHPSPRAAYAAARAEANENDKIVVFGSFVTVGEVMAYVDRGRKGLDG